MKGSIVMCLQALVESKLGKPGWEQVMREGAMAPTTIIMPSSDGGDTPPWSAGTNGWVRKVISPDSRRSSRLATCRSAELPPWPLRNTSRRAGVMAMHRPRSRSTASRVSAESQMVPGAQACSFDLV